MESDCVKVINVVDNTESGLLVADCLLLVISFRITLPSIGSLAKSTLSHAHCSIRNSTPHCISDILALDFILVVIY